MTYKEFLNKEVSTKKVLFQIGRLLTIDNSLWIKKYGSIWVMTYSWSADEPIDFNYGFGSFGQLSYGNSGLGAFRPEAERERVISVSSVVGDGTQLIELDSYEDLVETINNSFYWDSDNQLLYVNTDNGQSPLYRWSSVSAGISKTYSNYAGYYDGVYYDPRIKSLPKIATTRDNLYYGKIIFEGGSISLDNIDGYFDGFNSTGYYGTEVKLFFGGDDLSLSDYENVYTGVVDDFSFSGDNISISFIDPRKKLSEKIPSNSFNSTDYPDVSDDDLGRKIPIGYGVVRKALAIHIGSNIFKFVDTTYRNIKSITQVYLNDVEVSHSSEDLTSGTFELLSYTEGDQVYVSYEGYLKDDGVTLMENPVDIIQDIIQTYALYDYSEYYFNIKEWEEARLLSVYSIGFEVSESTEIIDVIGEISSSVFGSLIVNGPGQLSYNYRDTSKAAIKTIEFSEYLTRPSLDTSGSSDYLNSCRVGWSYSGGTGRYSYYENDSQKEALFKLFRVNNSQDYKTYISNIDDAVLLSQDILKSFGGLFPVWSILTKTQNIDLVVGDNVIINAKLRESAEDNYIKCEVLERSLDLDNFNISFSLRYIEDATINLTEASNGYGYSFFGVGLYG